MNISEEEFFTVPLDPYRGVTINKDQLPQSKEKFSTMLSNSIKRWKEEKARGIWLNIGIEKSEYISEAVKQGFVFHHTKPDYIVLTHWLSSEMNKLPGYASHYVGVGGVVINEKNEILAIQERVKTHEQNPWKIPGGLVDPDEFIADAAVREVYEETGIKAKFVSIIAFRETQSWRFGKNDIYFVALLKPETYEINHDPQEVGTCKWMPLEEYCSQKNLIVTQQKIVALMNLKLKKYNLPDIKMEDLFEFVSFSATPIETKIGQIARKSVFHSPQIAEKILKESSS